LKDTEDLHSSDLDSFNDLDSNSGDIAQDTMDCTLQEALDTEETVQEAGWEPDRASQAEMLDSEDGIDVSEPTRVD
ncbi:hypothetical protein C0992_001898, partial [Termitomyces sp. T32_za158]